MLPMNSLLRSSRKILLTLLLLLCAAWAAGEAAQWLLRWRALHLLADIRSIEVNRTTWSDAQKIITKWGQASAAGGACTSEACDCRINLVQTLPSMLVGYPDAGVRNWLPRLMDHLGLRNAAVRGGFTVSQGLVVSRWFGEQVTLPVRDWYLRSGEYVPELAVSSEESPTFRGYEGIESPSHPYRRVRNMQGRYGLLFHFLPQEDPSERAALMDFRFNCITQFLPCASEGEILPEGLRMVQDEQLSPPSR
jgi:hypothetical protein